MYSKFLVIYMLYGFKCFNKGLINCYGKEFEVGKSYHIDGDIKFGVRGNGFHMCINLEDTLRYFNAMEDEVDICYVEGSGKMLLYEDEYYGYYDMYVVKNLKIIKKLTREEIISYALNLPDYRVARFVSLFRLTKEEKELFVKKYNNSHMVLRTMKYYQNSNIDDKKIIKKVK